MSYDEELKRIIENDFKMKARHMIEIAVRKKLKEKIKVIDREIMKYMERSEFKKSLKKNIKLTVTQYLEEEFSIHDILKRKEIDTLFERAAKSIIVK